MDSTPLIAITGQVPVHLIGNDAFQEADIVGITMPVTKHSYQAKSLMKYLLLLNLVLKLLVLVDLDQF